jgi:hypothetical protein
MAKNQIRPSQLEYQNEDDSGQLLGTLRIELYRATNANRAMSLLFSSKCSTFLSSPDFHFVHVSRRGSPSGNPGSGRSWHVPRADRWR